MLQKDLQKRLERLKKDVVLCIKFLFLIIGRAMRLIMRPVICRRVCTAIAMSGGVDSSVAAALLHRQVMSGITLLRNNAHFIVCINLFFQRGDGRVFGIYMHNWDINEERAGRFEWTSANVFMLCHASCGSTVCTSERDYKDATEVARALGIEIVRSALHVTCVCSHSSAELFYVTHHTSHITHHTSHITHHSSREPR
jgi:NH3-dependent NAD+ synthetase